MRKKIFVLFCIWMIFSGINLKIMCSNTYNFQTPAEICTPEPAAFSEIEFYSMDSIIQRVVYIGNSSSWDPTKIYFDDNTNDVISLVPYSPTPDALCAGFYYRVGIFEPIHGISDFRIDIKADHLVPGTQISLRTLTPYTFNSLITIDSFGPANISIIWSDIYSGGETINLSGGFWLEFNTELFTLDVDLEEIHIDQILLSVQEDSYPVITPLQPPSGGLYSSTPFIQVGVNDQFPSEATFTIGGTSFYLIQNTENSSLFEISDLNPSWDDFWHNSLPDGQYSAEINAFDCCGNSDSCIVIIEKDTVPPNITMLTSLAPSFHDPPTFELEINDADTVKESVYFTIAPNTYQIDYSNHSQVYYFNQSCEDWAKWSLEWNEMLENSSIIFSVKDTAGNINNLTDYILRDDSGPVFQFLTRDGFTTNSTPEIIISVRDPNLDQTFLMCNGVKYNVTEVVDTDALFILNESSSDWGDWDAYFQSLEDGLIQIFGFSNDIYGEESPESFIGIYKDTADPEILSWDNPIYWSDSPVFSLDISDNIKLLSGYECLGSVAYSLNGCEWMITEEDLTSFSVIIQVNSTLWYTFNDGQLNLQIRVIDCAGNAIIYPKTIYKDTIFEFEIAIADSYYYETCPQLLVSSDENFTISGTYDGFEFTCGTNAIFTQDFWDTLSYGIHNFSIILRDIARNANITLFSIDKRDSTPQISVECPLENAMYEERFAISVNVTCEVLESIWFEIEGVEGSFEIPPDGFLPRSVWKQIPRNANATIIIYATSVHGMQSSVNITFFKLHIRPAPLELFDLTTPLGIFFISSFVIMFGVSFYIVRKRRVHDE